MVDEWTDIAIVEELSLFCRWVENGPVEHCMGILPLKKGNVEYIYSTLIDWLKKKKSQCPKVVGMGFDGVAMFVGKKSGVQARLKKNAPHALITNYSCHMLQQAIVQAAREQACYTTLTTLWKSSIAPQRDVKASQGGAESTRTP